MTGRFSAATFCALTSLLIGGCTFEDKTITIAVSTEEPAPTIAETIHSMLESRGFSVTIVETATDPIDTLTAIDEHQVDLAIVEEPDRPLPGLITLAPLYPGVLHVMHNRPSDSYDFAALIRGASVYAGPLGGAAHRLLLKLTEDFGVRSDEFQVLDNPWITTPDVYFIIGGLLPTDSAREFSGYRLFSFKSEGDVEGGTIADGIALRHHHVRPFLLPKSLYSWINGEAVLTLSIRTVLIAHENFDSELAYDISSALFSNAQDLSLTYPLVTRELNEGLRSVDLMLPLHTGTRQYLDRNRPGFVERNVDVLALYLTIALALLSGTFALYRYRLQVRKDRVDVYYSQLLDIRREMTAAPAGGGEEFKNKVLDVQREVLDLLIDERIEADTSLIAFVSLSNQMINELDRRSDAA